MQLKLQNSVHSFHENSVTIFGRENGLKIFSNSSMGIKDIEKFCILDSKAKNILNMAMQKFSMSARSYNKILKVSRTIADIENKEIIETSHITEALQYRFNLN